MTAFFDVKINGKVFRQKREKLRLSVRDVEHLTGVSRSTVSNLETGRNSPDGANLIRLMRFFSLTAEDISLRS